MNPAQFYPPWLLNRLRGQCPLPPDQVVTISTLAFRTRSQFSSSLVEVTPQRAGEAGQTSRHYVLLHSIASVTYLGCDTEESVKQLVALYTHICAHGDPFAITQLALLFLNGVGPIKSPPLARLHFLEAATAGFIRAQISLAYMLTKGIGGEPNDPEAAFWLEKAADQGDAHGQFLFGTSLLAGKGVEQATDEGIEYLLDASLQGHPGSTPLLTHLADVERIGEAQFAMAILWDEGLIPGHPRSPLMVRSYLEKAARNGIEDAQEALERERLPQPDPNQIADALNVHASAQHRSECCFHHAHKRAMERGLQQYARKEFALAKMNFLIAAPSFPYALHMLGILALDGCGQEKNLTNAAHCFSHAIKNGCLKSILPLTKILWENGSREDAVSARQLLIYGAEKGDAEIQGKLALDYFRGIGGNPDVALARHFALEAHKNGDSSILILFAHILSTEDTYKDEALAFQCIQLAAQGKRPDALYHLGQFHLQGIGTEINLTEAKRCFAEAERLGYRRP